MEYLVVDMTVEPREPGVDLLVALLSEAGYESFEETPYGLKGYLPSAEFQADVLTKLPPVQNGLISLSYTTEALSQVNWNEEWERQYDPVEVDGWLRIRAPFHPARSGFKHEIVIQPQMSFGTGHHHTTRLMARQMAALDFTDARVLDMGTGTGVLAILAEGLGAAEVDAVDNFDWAADNTRENAQRNACSRINAQLGDAHWLEGQSPYHILLANINRNVLLADMGRYIKVLQPGGYLVTSGYLKQDEAKIKAAAQALGLVHQHSLAEEDWRCDRWQAPLSP
ncbi:MAG: 50S ribosomal protein L11 methyltransferase [Schleiferiaceae bacterium]|nr:50S ribosomal protein L11 methyltransferase [Schleiferiaceae bacterium]